MKPLEYGDQDIGGREISIAVASMILGVGIFTLPRVLAGETRGSDGWISIVLAGIVVGLSAYVAAKLAVRFPGQTFAQYTARIASKPFAVAIVFSFGVYAIMHTAFEIRSMGNIAEMYLFSHTPTSVIVLLSLLVVAYAVAGSRVVILRLNLMFFPIALFFGIAILLLNIGSFEWENLLPVFTSDWRQLIGGAKEAAYKMIGFEIVLFYALYSNQRKETPKAAMRGLFIITFLYVMVYIFCLGVFGTAVTQNIVYPTIELARQVEVPGEFFERFESIFFTVWIMTIFNTAFMALDIAMLSFYYLFKKGKKIVYICVLCPIIYIIAMLSPNVVDFIQYSRWVSVFGLALGAALPTVLLIVAKIRGVKGND